MNAELVLVVSMFVQVIKNLLNLIKVQKQFEMNSSSQSRLLMFFYLGAIQWTNIEHRENWKIKCTRDELNIWCDSSREIFFSMLFLYENKNAKSKYLMWICEYVIDQCYVAKMPITVRTITLMLKFNFAFTAYNYCLR